MQGAGSAGGRSYALVRAADSSACNPIHGQPETAAWQNLAGMFIRVQDEAMACRR